MIAPAGVTARDISPAAVCAPPSDRRLYAINLAAATAVILFLPLFAYMRVMLFSFYVRGSFLLDAGLFADLLWHSDLALTQPSSVGGGSYFAIHATPIFLPISLLSRIVPLSMPQFFSLFIATVQTLPGAAIFWMVVAADARRGLATPWLGALAGLGFAFSGLAIAILRYPHFEPLIAGFFLLFITALVRGRPRLAAAFFTCGLLVREDAGLHYLAVLGLMIALDVMRGIGFRRQRLIAGFAVAGLLYSCLAMLAQRLAFPSHASSFSLVYLGNPPLAHLTAPAIRDRLLYFIGNRPYIWAPACAVGLWARIAREPFLALGYLACVPWLVLQFLAASPFAAALASYYAFPCLIGMAWPLVAVLYRRTGANGTIHPLAGFAMVVLLSFVPGRDLHDPGRLPVIRAILQASPSAAQQAEIEQAVAVLSRARPLLGRLMVDNSIVALRPDAFARTEIETTPGMGAYSAETADTVVFFADGYDGAHFRALAENNGLMNRYAIKGTPLHLASRFSLSGAPGLNASIVPE
jgi:hypothetical protein